MTTTYKWIVSSLDVAPSEDGLTDVIKTVHWRLLATDDGDGVTAETYGAQELAEPGPGSFTPYDEVTEGDVIGWVEAALGKDRVQDLRGELSAAIVGKRQPAIVSVSPPWQ